mmetsp:Transcript_14947/g.41027  ORF Transcript_14947/g.41027 Transcript_14947/m.41027 type:complete len:210 (-) Transcript_14947:429-1058(-)
MPAMAFEKHMGGPDTGARSGKSGGAADKADKIGRWKRKNPVAVSSFQVCDGSSSTRLTWWPPKSNARRTSLRLQLLARFKAKDGTHQCRACQRFGTAVLTGTKKSNSLVTLVAFAWPWSEAHRVASKCWACHPKLPSSVQNVSSTPRPAGSNKPTSVKHAPPSKSMGPRHWGLGRHPSNGPYRAGAGRQANSRSMAEGAAAPLWEALRE